MPTFAPSSWSLFSVDLAEDANELEGEEAEVELVAEDGLGDEGLEPEEDGPELLPEECDPELLPSKFGPEEPPPVEDDDDVQRRT
ncbi:unnamed protein product [Linum trigynum]|uniref:Uncharacterized protein n=1 Tax=Linum trigynum TaxID=586398 RepID=A0AAV2E9I0_9ROSI